MKLLENIRQLRPHLPEEGGSRIQNFFLAALRGIGRFFGTILRGIGRFFGAIGRWIKRHKLVTAALLLALCAGGYLGFTLLWAPSAAEAISYEFIRTVTLTRGSLENAVSVSGTVNSGSTADVTVAEEAKTYKIATVDVQVGDVVEAGDVIATLDTSDLERSIESATESYNDGVEAAQKSYDRAVESYDDAVKQHEEQLADLAESVAKAEREVSEAWDELYDAADIYDGTRADYNVLRQAVASAESEISSYTNALNQAADDQNDAVAAANSANSTLTAAEQALASAESAYNTAKAADEVGSTDETQAALAQAEKDKETATKAKEEAEKEAEQAEEELEAAQQAFDLAEQALARAQESCSLPSQGLYGYSAMESALNQAESELEQAESALEQAENALESAEEQLTNANDNYDDEAEGDSLRSAEQNVEDALDNLEDAKEVPDNLTELQSVYDDCTLTATMSGTITDLNATVGSVCGETVATIQDTEALRIDVTIQESDINQVALGMRCLIQSDATEGEISGTLTQIDPISNEQGVFGAQVTVGETDTGLLIGMNASVDIILSSTEDCFTVPKDAVGNDEDGQGDYVYRQTGGSGTEMTFEKVYVTTGESNDYYIEITADSLTEGDVIRATADLSQGVESVGGEDAATEETTPAVDFGGMGGMGGGMPSGGGMPGGGGGMPGGMPGGM